MRIATIAAPAALILALISPAAAETILDREFLFAPERFHLVRGDQSDRITVDGALPSLEAGQPEWPWVGQLIDLPARTRIARVELLGVDSEPWESGVRLPSAWVTSPQSQKSLRSSPDPIAFSRAGFQPDRPVELGAQGSQRGKNLSTLRVCPIRWEASTGKLERVRRVRVRLHLEPATATTVERLRRVPWEASSWSISRGSLKDRGAASLEGSFGAPQIPSLLGSPIAYVIITNDAMAPEFQRLADWKTQTGMPAVVRTMSFIRANYPRGSDDAERVRDFLRDAYARWGTDWVLLGGDTEIIPTRFARSAYYTGDDIASDLYFSCLDGNWDADGDHIYGEAFMSVANPGDDVDMMPELYVGRAPVSNVTEAQKFVDRTLQYIKTPVGDYEKSILMFAEVLFPEDWEPGDGELLDGGTLGDELLPYINHNPSMRNVRMYQNWTDTLWVPPVLPETKATVLDSLDRGYGFAVHIGHGYRNVMSLGDANMFTDDVMALSNEQRLFNLYAINCTSNAIDFPCIGEAFLKAPHGGAVTSVGSTRLDFPYAGRAFEKEYFRVVFDDSVTAAGEAQARQKLTSLSQSVTETAYRWMQFSLLLLGDPELRMWTGTPRTMSVTHPASFPLQDSALAVTVQVSGQPVAGARVVAYKVNDTYVVGMTNAAGQVTLPFRADSVGSVTLTVTAYDCRPYQASLGVTPSVLAVLSDGAPVLDDDAVSGTDGDADGIWDAGETIDLRVPLRNTGNLTATSVSAVLTTPDTTVVVLTGSQSYGTIAPGSQVTSAGAFRLRLSKTAPDQREVPLNVQITAGGAATRLQQLRIMTRAPELRHFSHTVLDAGGNADGRPDPGETATMTFTLRNLGSGDVHGVTAVLRSINGQCTITDSTATWGNLAAGEERSASDGFVIQPSASTAILELHVSDTRRKHLVQRLDIGYPSPPVGVTGRGKSGGIELAWTKSPNTDLLGYNLYRSGSDVGPFTRVNPVPSDRIATMTDAPLTPLTRYYFRVAAVDSSGNESAPSVTTSASTNPPTHGFFPIPMTASSIAPVTVEHLTPGHPLDILTGSDFIYGWHPDGTAITDADGGGSSNGDLTVRGSNYEGGVSIGDVNADGSPDVVGVASDSTRVVVLDRTGALLPGWPKTILDRAWSSVAMGDLDNDGDRELVFGAFSGPRIYAFRHDGTEWMDGDSSPGTLGVFKVLGNQFNIGTPAIADLDGNGVRDIIYGSFDGKVYAWRPDGSNLPGFPVTLPEPITASVAVGYLDGPADTQLDIAVVTGYYPNGNPTKDSLYVITATGARKAGFPKVLRASDVGKAPSPALADMNNDGFLDIVAASTNGKLYVYDRTGAIVGLWNGVPFSSLTVGATEASPVVADINGDGLNDVVIGDETGNLNAIGGTVQPMPGFPIQVAAAIKSAAALCDCDGDGKSEVVLSGSDPHVFMWDYDFPFSPSGKPPWPQFHHDAMRTGLYSNPAFVDVTPEQSAMPARLELAAPSPNPSRGAAATMTYAIPRVEPGTRLELGIYDLTGRKLRVLQQGVAEAGRSRVVWDLKDGAGKRVEPGIYFLRVSVGSEATARKIVVMN